jgi:hypothetical protein
MIKKFKIEKSRSTLWREARCVGANGAVLQDEGYEVGHIVNDNTDFDNVHQFAEHIAGDPRDDGSSYDEGCQIWQMKMF